MDADEVPFSEQVSISFVAKVITALIGFVGTILFARLLGPVDFGGYYLLLAVVMVAIRPVSGFAEACRKRTAETQTDTAEILGAAAIAVVILSALAGGLGFAFRSWLSTYTGIDSAATAGFFLITILGAFFLIDNLITGTGHLARTYWLDLLRSVFTLPGQLAFVLLGFGPVGMAYGLSLATALMIPAGGYLLGVRPSPPSAATIGGLVKYAKFSAVSHTLGKAKERFDILLLGVLATQADAGLYQTAFMLTIPAGFVAEIIGNGLVPRISAADSKGTFPAEDLYNALAFNSVLAFPLFFGALALAEPVARTVYGPEFAGAAPFIIIIAAFRVIDAQTSGLAATFSGIDRPEVVTMITGISLVINVLFGVALTLWFGPIGVVVATLMTSVLDYLAYLVVLRNSVSLSTLVPTELGEQLAASLLMFGVVSTLHHYVPVNHVWDLLLLVGVGVVVFGLALVALSGRTRYTLLELTRQV